jgi:hypothetical protein
MSDDIALALLAVLVLSAIIAYLAYLYSRRDLARLHEYEFFADKFFRAASTLVDEPDTPERMLSSLELLNSIINNEPTAKKFFSIYERFALEQIDSDKSETIPELAAFVRAHKNIEKVVVEAYMSGLLAATFLNNRWGLRARAMLADLYGRESKPSTVIRAIEESRNLSPALAAAAA